MNHLDLFSGIGGFALACKNVFGDEYRNQGHCEIDEFACSIYHRHFPNSECLGNIRDMNWIFTWRKLRTDILTAGFPCQPHSIIGKQRGSKDERDLWSECARAIKYIRPRYAVFENVPGLIKSEHGKTWDRIRLDLEESGYVGIPILFSASDIRAPHKRERIWIVAYSNGDGEVGERRNGNNKNEERNIQEKIQKRKNEFARTFDANKNVWERPWSEVATELCRVDDGVSRRVDRLRLLGNSIVPQCAMIILESIKALDNV